MSTPAQFAFNPAAMQLPLPYNAVQTLGIQPQPGQDLRNLYQAALLNSAARQGAIQNAPIAHPIRRGLAASLMGAAQGLADALRGAYNPQARGEIAREPNAGLQYFYQPRIQAEQDYLNTLKGLGTAAAMEPKSQPERLMGVRPGEGIYSTTQGMVVPPTTAPGGETPTQKEQSAMRLAFAKIGKIPQFDQSGALTGLKDLPGFDAAGGKFNAEQEFIGDYLAANKLSNTPANRLKAIQAYKNKPESIGQTLEAALLARQLLSYTAQFNPKLLPTISPVISRMLGMSGGVNTQQLQTALSAIPAGTPTDISGQPIGTSLWRATGPTNQQRNRGQFARDAIQYLHQDVYPNLSKIQGNTGPVKGALEGMMARYGLLNDPDFVSYMANSELMKGAIASIHFGGRGIAEQFQGAIDYLLSPRQPLNVLRGNLKQFEDLLRIYAESGGPSITQPPLPAASGPTTAKPVGKTARPDGIYEMNGKQYRVEGGNVYAQ